MSKKGFNVEEHKLVPKHEIASEEEREKILKKYGVEAHQLPKIKSRDPVAKAIGATSGDILKITRESPTAGEVVVYRYVL